LLKQIKANKLKNRQPAGLSQINYYKQKRNKLTSIIATTVIAVVGWFIGHQLSISRDIKNKRTEIKIGYLIEAYRKLERVSNSENPDRKNFETAIADIQLLGTRRQVKLAQDIAIQFEKDSKVSLVLCYLNF